MLSRKLQKVETGAGFTVEPSPTWKSILAIEKDLCDELTRFIVQNSLAGTIYNPLIYAQDVHAAYLQRYMNSRKYVLFLGLNPGPNGMCQNGVE